MSPLRPVAEYSLADREDPTMAPRTTLPDGSHCAVHAERIERLEDSIDSLRSDQREAQHEAAGQRTELALLRQAVDQLALSIGALRLEIREAAAKREADLKAELDRRAMPSRGQLQVVIVAAFLALCLGWVGANLLPKLPQAQVAQAASPSR